jgi:hypothetical protein
MSVIDPLLPVVTVSFRAGQSDRAAAAGKISSAEIRSCEHVSHASRRSIKRADNASG